MPSVFNPLTNRYHEVDEQTAAVFSVPRGRSVFNPLTGRRHDLSPEDTLTFYPELAQAREPEPVEQDVEWADYGKAIMAGGAGVVSGLGWLVDKLEGENTGIGEAIMGLGNRAVDYWNESLSDAAKRELAKEFIVKTEDEGYEWGDASLSTVGLFGAQSLLSTAAGAGLGAGATKVLQVFGNPAGRSVLARTADWLVPAGTKGKIGKFVARPGTRAAVMAEQARKKLRFVDQVLGAAGFGIGEGTVGGAMTGVNVEREVMNLPAEQLLSSERGRQIYESTEGLLDEDKRLEYVRETLAKEASTAAGWQAGITTALLGAPAGAYFGPLLSRIGTGRAGSILKGAGIEAGQEFAQSGTEQLIANLRTAEVGAEVGAWENVLNAAIGGAAAGAPIGGVLATAGPTDRQVAKSEERRKQYVAGGVNYGPLVANAQEAKKAGATDEEILPIMQQARQPGQLIPALAELRRLRDQKLAEAEATTPEPQEMPESAKTAPPDVPIETPEAEPEQGRTVRPSPKPEEKEPVTEGVVSTPEELEAVAQEAATSPANEFPEPTEAQIEAGNYKKPRVKVAHLPEIRIENPKGSKRRGKRPDGTEWEHELTVHYGYFTRTAGADNQEDGTPREGVDVFVGPNATDASLPAFVIDQKNPDGSFDETKVVLGIATEAEARQVYLDQYDTGWQGLGAITQMSPDELKAFLADEERTSRPVAYQPPQEEPTDGQAEVETQAEAEAQAAPDVLEPKRPAKPRLAESGDDLYEQIVQKTEEGIVTDDAGILYPVVVVPGEGTYSVRRSGIERIENGGVTATPVSAAEADRVHDAINKDQVVVQVMTKWGGSGRDTRSKLHHVIHSPSGRAFERRAAAEPEPSPGKSPEEPEPSPEPEAPETPTETPEEAEPAPAESPADERLAAYLRSRRDRSADIARQRNGRPLNRMQREAYLAGFDQRIAEIEGSEPAPYDSRNERGARRTAYERGQRAAGFYVGVHQRRSRDRQGAFRRGGGDGMPARAVLDRLSPAIEAVSPILTVRVVQSVDELPGNAAPSDTEGVYFNRGAVYLVADNLSEERIEEVFRHEVFGHAAMERHPDFPQWVEQIQRARRIKGSTIQKLAAEVAGRQGLLDPVTEAKEIIALMAERGVKNSLMDRIIAAFRKFFRSIGLTKDVSEAEIRTWLAKGARQFMSDAEFTRRVPGATLTAESTDEEVLAAINTAFPDDSIDATPLYSRAYAAADVEEAMARVMVTPDEDLTVADRVRRWWRDLTDLQEGRVKQGLLDSAHAVRLLEEGLFGQVLDATDSAYKATLATKNLPSVVASILKRGAPVIKDGVFQPVAGRKSVMEIFQPVTDHADGNLLAQWEFFAAANRASRLITEENPDGTLREKNFSAEDIEKGLSLEEQYPFFRDVLNEWTAFNQQILDIAEAAGVVNAEERALWEKNDYVPFYRAMGDDVKGPRGKRGIADQRSGIRRLKGSEAALGSVFENMMMNVAHLIDASFRNVAMQRVTAMAEQTGVMEKLPPQWAPTAIDNRQIAKRLAEAGIEVGELTKEQKESWSKVFRRVRPAGKDIVSVMVDGKPVWYRVTDPMLLSSITLMGQESYSALMGLFRAPKKWLTTGVTATPEFMLANLIRDTLSTWVVSDIRKNPFKGIGSAMKATFTEDEDLMALMMAGAGGGGYYDSNPEQIRKLLAKQMPRDKVDGFLKTILHPKTAWRFWQKVGASTENANRIAIFRQVIANGGSVAEAAYQARDVLNFTMSGDFTVIRALIQSVPFLNARIQGLYRLARGAKANPKAFTAKGIVLMALTLALLARNQDEEEYEELPEWEKDTYWHVFVGGEHIRIPKPFEVGAMFATLPERLVRTASGRDDFELLTERVQVMLLETFAFNPVPQLVKPVVEQYANRNMFTGSPIVGLSEKGLEPEAQYVHYTSEAMRALAEGMPDFAPAWLRSPKRLEAAIRGYFGSLGTYAIGTADAVVRTLGGYPAPAATTIYDLPLVQRFLRAPEPRQSRFQDMLYSMLDESNSVFRTINRYQAQGLMEQARELRDENINQLRVRTRLNRIRTAVRKVNNQMKLVMFHKTLSPEEKRKRMDELQARKNDILAEVAPFEEFF